MRLFLDIDELLIHTEQAASQQSNASSKDLIIPKAWSQGRTVYGGLSAGMLYQSARLKVTSDRVLRSMNTSFVGPLLSQTPFSIRVEIVREGKNVSQIQARAIQNEKVCVLSQFCFAQARSSKISVSNNQKHDMAAPKKANFIPQIPKVTPKFLRHFELCIDQGGIPFTGRASSIYHGWMRYKAAPQTFTDAHLISIIDAWPPTLLQMLKWPAPASTVCWNLEFLHPKASIERHDWLAYQSCTRQAADGYGHTEANIWNAKGELIALSRQTVAVFD